MPIYTGMINSKPINTDVLNKIYHTLAVDFEGTIVTFNDSVTHYSEFSGTIISFNDSVTSEFSGTIVKFKDNVNETSDFYSRNGYQVYIYIGNQLIPPSRYRGKLSSSHTTGGTSNLSFQLLPLHGVQDIEYYQGLPIEVDVQMPDGIHRIFTGYVDSPSVELCDEYITISCTDRRSNRILTTMYSSLCPITSITDQSSPLFDLDTVGYYSTSVFGTPKDTVDELDKRMSTIPFDFDFDNYGNISITPWSPKEVADFTLNSDAGPYNDNKVYYDGQAVVQRTNKAGTINTVNIAIKHTYNRLHQQVINVSWPGYDEFIRDWYDIGRPSFPQKTSISSAASNGKWKVMDDITFVNLWPAQGFAGGPNGVLVWQPNKETEYTRPQLIFGGYLRNLDGSFVTLGSPPMYVPIYTPVIDPTTGEPFLEVYKTVITDTSSMLCRGANWTACINFSQSVTEYYNIQLIDPVGVSNYGTISNTESYSVSSPFNTSAWETSGGFILEDHNVYIDELTNMEEVNFSLEVALNKGKCELLKANRDGTVTFNRSIWPQIDIYHTVELDIFACQTIARVYKINHNIDFNTGFATTNVQLALSLANGSVDETPLALPPRPAEDPSYIGLTLPNVNLGYHNNFQFTSASKTVTNTWNGAIENCDISQSAVMGAYRSANSTQFIVDYPPIGTELTGARDLRGTWTIGGTNIYATTFQDLLFKRTQVTGTAGSFDDIIASGGVAYAFQGDIVTSLTPVEGDNIVIGTGGVLVGSPTSDVAGVKYYYSSYNLLYSTVTAFSFVGTEITSLTPSSGDNIIFGFGDLDVGSDISDVMGDGGQYHFTILTDVINGEYGIIDSTKYNINIPNDYLVVDLHVYS